jgi:1-acyl-sn-glycerol-3-phosphate acyltransferase
MADLHGSDPYGQPTAELALSEIRAALPASPEELRDALPGLEPERQITDWGRSERVERLLDRTVVGFLYHYWFRVEVEGIENVPASGGALLVSNHGGAIPPDGAMIGKAVGEAHQRPRPLHLAVEPTFANLPGVGMLQTKLGVVGTHPANLHRLLFDEQQLVLTFPEGRKATRKALSERYRMARFQSTAFIEAAMRARVPIVPVAVLGAEESVPVFARLPRLRISTGLPLPAKFRIRFLEPVSADSLGDGSWDDDGLVQTLSHDIRALIQENLLELVAQRRSVWLG